MTCQRKVLRSVKLGPSSKNSTMVRFEVEFADDNGRAYAFAALTPKDVLKLRFTPMTAASA